MITYIGFSTKTHKILARIICHKYKHCAPIKSSNNNVTIYQFIKPHKIIAIPIKKRDLDILEHHGWKFVRYKAKIDPRSALKIRAITCVQFTKRALGIKKTAIQTPDDLLKYITRK